MATEAARPKGEICPLDSRARKLDYEIRYVKGTENNAADFLSRLESVVDVRVNDEYEFMDRLVYNLPASTTLMDEIFAGQRADTAVALVAKQLKEHGLVKYGRYRNHQLAMANGFVTRANRVLVPGVLRELVLTRIHNASQLGENRTFHLLRSQALSTFEMSWERWG